VLRVFTRDVGTKFIRGQLKDYTPTVWKGIARSAGLPLDKFTIDPEAAADAAIKAEQPKKRGRPRKVRG
jgi:hypothetical protein